MWVLYSVQITVVSRVAKVRSGDRTMELTDQHEQQYFNQISIDLFISYYTH